MGDIFYFCPDFSPPSGGTRRLYRHVHHLNNLGSKAFIVHLKKGFALTWHDYKVPVLWLEDNLSFAADDILVFPEGMPSLMKETQQLNCSRIAIALNWSYIYNSLPKGENWKDYGITRVITPSPVIKNFLELTMGLDVTLIDNYIDANRYSYQPEKKKNKIVYLTRKDPSGDILSFIFKSKEGFFKEWEWMPLNNISEDKYAEQLGESRIFLATSSQEGMPTSALEAMASGCLVVGYSGIGGNDYMVGEGAKQNCHLIENGNLPELAKILEEVILNWNKNTQRDNLIIKNAGKTAKCFQDFEKEGRCLKNYFDRLTLKQNTS
mgnify:CR=1 FL=1|tara:strand:- start:12818 stop:13783 length:966 start_codon:yes stop_codon:yes gene_type:complete